MSGGSAGFSTMIALPLPRAADLLEAARRRPGELVDVRAGARARRSARDAGDDLRVGRRRDARDRRDDRNRRLPAARDEVHVRLVGELVHVDRGNEVRADGRRREIDDLLRMAAQHRVVARVRAGRRRVEHDRDVVEARHLDETVDAVGRSPARRAGARAPVRPSRDRCRRTRPSRAALDVRRTLIIRSVPMLPLPMIATLTLIWIHRIRLRAYGVYAIVSTLNRFTGISASLASIGACRTKVLTL